MKSEIALEPQKVILRRKLDYESGIQGRSWARDIIFESCHRMFMEVNGVSVGE